MPKFILSALCAPDRIRKQYGSLLALDFDCGNRDGSLRRLPSLLVITKGSDAIKVMLLRKS